MRNKLSSTITCARLMPRFRPVICRMRSLARWMLLGAIPSLPFQRSRWPRNFRSPTLGDGAADGVDAQPEFLFQKLGYRFHPSLPRRQRSHVNVAVVGVATEAMTAAFQFPVEIIQ